jgi:DNA-binding XRE family transcriptional regulator
MAEKQTRTRKARIGLPEFVGDDFDEHFDETVAKLSPKELAMLNGYRSQYSLANQLIELRKGVGLTQQQLAARAQVPQSSISRLERRGGRVSQLSLQRIAAALGTYIGFIPRDERPTTAARARPKALSVSR